MDLHTTEQEKVCAYIDTEAIANVAARDAMDLSWEEGLTEIESFFDVDAYVDDANKEAGGGETGSIGGAGHVYAPEQVNKGQRPPAIISAEDLPVELEHEVMSNGEDYGGSPQSVPDAIIEHRVDAAPVEEDDRMGVEHVTASAPAAGNDDADPAPSEQPHLTGPAASDVSEEHHTEPAQTREDDAVKTRSRQNSANIASIVSNGGAPAHTAPVAAATEGAAEKTSVEARAEPGRRPQQEPPIPSPDTRDTAPGQQANSAAPTPSPISPALPQDPTPEASLPARPAEPTPTQSVEPTTPFTPGIMTPSGASGDTHPLSSEGKSSLMEEMRKEDEGACPDRRTWGVSGENAVDGGEETEDEDEFADAPSSPVGFKERLEGVMGQKEDVSAARDGEAVEEEELENGVVEEEEEVQRDGKVDALADSGTDFEVHEGAESDLHAGAGDGDVALKSAGVKEEADAKEAVDQIATVEAKKNARTRKNTNTARPQTRRRSTRAAATEPTNLTSEQEQEPDAPGPTAEDGSSMAEKEQQDTRTAPPDLSEDELAAASPRTIPRKRKASSSAGIITNSDSPKVSKTLPAAKKKAKIVAFAREDDEIADANAAAGDADLDAAPMAKAMPKSKKRTKAEINASKRPRHRRPGKQSAVGAFELRGLGVGGAGDDAAAAEGGGDVAAGREDAVVRRGKGRTGGGADDTSLSADARSTHVPDGNPRGDGGEVEEAGPPPRKKQKGGHIVGARELNELGNTSFSARVDAPSDGDEEEAAGPAKKKHGWHHVGARALRELGAAPPSTGSAGGQTKRTRAALGGRGAVEQGKKKEEKDDDVSKAEAANQQGKGGKGGKK